MKPFTLTQAVGRGCPNRAEDVMALHGRLMALAKIPCYQNNGTLDDTIMKGLQDVQRHYMHAPDLVVSPGGKTQSFLAKWKNKPMSPRVKLPGLLKMAWDLVDPLLPEGSRCASGFRSPEEQRAILHTFFTTTYRPQIIAKYGATKYHDTNKNLVAHEKDVLTMVRGVGQAIAAPGTSMHQRGKAIDVGGPPMIDKEQVAVIGMVANAHPSLFSGKILLERNGCVHFEIR